MSLKIRMSRGGAKKHPFYRIVVADTRSPRDGRFIEKLGTFDPMLPKGNADRVVLKEERIKYWISVGARPSDRVARMLGAANIAPAPKIPEQTKQHLPRAKTLERMKEAEEAAKAKAEAEEAAKAKAEAEKAAAEAPAEEAPAEAPAEEAKADAAPAEEASVEAPAEEAKADAAPAEEAKADAAPAEEAPAEAPAEEAKAEEAPAEEAPAEEEKKED